MPFRSCLCCAVLVLVPSIAIGQPYPSSQANGSSNGDQYVTRAEFDELLGIVKDLKTVVETSAKDTKSQLAQLRTDVNAIADLQTEDRELLRALSKTDSEGRTIPRLDAAQDSVRREIRRAVPRSLPKYGIVFLVNRMGNDQVVAVNGRTYLVMAGTHKPVRVPLGSFKVKLRNQEAQRFYVGIPNEYRTWVTIRPAGEGVFGWDDADPDYWSYASN